MKNDANEYIAKTLVEVEAFKDLPAPVILTSGELGIYYINTEKLAQDGGAWENYAEDSQAMISHCVAMARAHESFGKTISFMAEKVHALFPDDVPMEKRLIAGGQRRDWLFSGPIAQKLGLAHVSLHKDESAYLLSPDGSSIETLGESDSVLKDMYVVHVVDLLTKGSSAYNPNVSPPSGWIVELRKRGATIEHLVSVVSRLQGAEEILGDQGVEVYAFVTIDTDFVSNYSNQRERALAYMQDPMAWSQNYLRDHGVAAFKESFDPASGKLARAEKFLALFESTLAELGLLEGLRGRMSSAN